MRLKTKLFYLSHDAHDFGQRVFGFLHPPRTGKTLDYSLFIHYKHPIFSILFSYFSFPGHYSFGISSDDSSELWLSSDDDPKNSRLIAWVGNLSDPFWQEVVGDGEFTKYESQISSEIFLRRNRRYYVEALHKQSTSSDHLLVAWKIPHVRNFSHITRGRISRYIHPHELHNLDVTRYARHIPITPAVLQKPLILEKLRNQVVGGATYLRENSEAVFSAGVDAPDRYPIGKSGQFERHSNKSIHGPEVFPAGKNTSHPSFKTKQATKRMPINKPHINGNVSHFAQSFANLMYPSCDYKPSYQVDFKVARYEGVYLIHETAVYPDDMTHLKHVESFKPCFEMRQTDSHGVLLPGVQDYDDDLNRQTSISGNIVTANHRDIRRSQFGLESNFSRKKSFHKRMLLEYMQENNRINRKYERTQDQGKMTSRSRSQEAVIGYRNDFENNSDQDLVKTSTEPERTNHIEEPVKAVEGFSYDREGKATKRENKMFGNKSVKSKARDPRTPEDKVMKFVKTGKRFPVENENFKVTNTDKVKSQDTKIDKLKQVISRRKTANKSAGNPESLNTSESWETMKERLQKRRAIRQVAQYANLAKRDALGQNSMNNQVIGKKETYWKKRQYNISISDKKPKTWHRKRQRTRTKNILVEDSSPFALTFQRLIESGQWSEIKKYAERKGLLLTKNTWMYVTWKFLRYEKPKKPHDKLAEFIYKQNPTKCRSDGNILLNQQVSKECELIVFTSRFFVRIISNFSF